jgi:hypothetical protein
MGRPIRNTPIKDQVEDDEGSVPWYTAASPSEVMKTA